MSNLKAVIFGGGSTGQLCARYLLEKNVDVVAMFTRTSHVGREIGDLIGMPGKISAKVSCNPEAEMQGLAPDIAIVGAGSLLGDLIPLVELCGKHGVDVICLNENAFYPWVDPFLSELVRHIDEMAKAYGISVYASGVQDAMWHAIPLTAFSVLHRISEVKITSVCNVDKLGMAVLKHCMIGENLDNFKAKQPTRESENVELHMPPLDGAVRGIPSSMGLELKEHEYSVTPIISEEDIFSNGLEKLIPKGNIIGLKELTRVVASDGTLFIGEFISQVMNEDEPAGNTLKIVGEPDIEFHTPTFPGNEVTSATLVNRIPDVLHAAPGFLHTNNLPAPRYRPLIAR